MDYVCVVVSFNGFIKKELKHFNYIDITFSFIQLVKAMNSLPFCIKLAHT